MLRVILTLALLLRQVPASQPLDLKVEISLADKVAIVTGDQLLVLTTIKNEGSAEQTIGVWSCSYPRQWESDNAQIQVPDVPCKKNDVFEVRLGSGQSYTRNLMVRIRPAQSKDISSAVTFRLGFKPFIARRSSPIPIWSNPITVHTAE
jgi:hypothetical protein